MRDDRLRTGQGVHRGRFTCVGTARDLHGRMTRPLASGLLLLLLAPAVALAQERPVRGTTDAGRPYTGVVHVEGQGAARVVVAVVEVEGLGRRTLRRPDPGAASAPDVRLLERAGGLAGALSAGGGGGLELALVRASSGLPVVVDERARGAWFRKVSGAASASYVGLEARGRLPLVSLDPQRFHTPASSEGAWLLGPLDRPSVYLGGRADGHELDCGLTWDRVYDAQGRPTFTDLDGCDGGDPARRFARLPEGALVDGAGRAVAPERARELLPRLAPNFAFRPFWRTTGSAGNLWHQPRVGAADNVYLYPGEPVLLRVEAVGRDRVRLLVRGGAAAQVLDVTFTQEGFGRGRPQAWKRVSSIDQFRQVVVAGQRLRRGNEGRDALPTRARVTGAVWFEVHLLRADGGRAPLMGAPHLEVRGADSAPRYAEVFRRRAFTTHGGEELDIVPPSP